MLKPIDTRQVAAICAASRVVVVFEEHSIHAGLGSIVSEIASELAPTRVLRIGVRDRFSRYCGSYDYLLREHGLDKPAIATRVSEYLAGL